MNNTEAIRKAIDELSSDKRNKELINKLKDVNNLLSILRTHALSHTFKAYNFDKQKYEMPCSIAFFVGIGHLHFDIVKNWIEKDE